jgi:hypothetical protein
MVDPSSIQSREEWTAALQALRDLAGLSYARLSERCGGISTSTLQKMVIGESFPRAATVRLFVQACGVRDVQPWVNARNRVQAADPRLQRRRTPPGKQIRVGAVPQPADCFQDREVAKRLEQAAEEGGTVVLTQLLAGMGGVGKTQLAAVYARRAWQQGVGVLVWVSASSRDGIVSAYASAALRLGLPLADRDDPEQAAREFLAWAETTTDRWWLVVLDDVQRPGDLTGLWPPTATSAVGGEVVVTTRRREAALSTSDRHTINIAIFTPAEAFSYLRAKLTHRAADTTEAAALAEDLGRLPLALAQAATYILNEDIDCAEYRRRLARHLMPRVLPSAQDLPDDHQQIINATWELSIDQADQAEPVGLARPVLYLTSVLDPAGIPQSVLSSSPALEYLTSYLPASHGQGVSPEIVDGALRVLHRYCVIDHDRAAAHREIQVHQLVQRATRENLASQPDLGSEMYVALAGTAADALLAVWPNPEHGELSQILRVNTTALVQAADGALWDSVAGIPHVLLQAAISFANAGQYTTAVAAYTDLHSTALQRLGPDHPDLLITRSNLAACRSQAGDTAGAAAAFKELIAAMARAQEGQGYSAAFGVRIGSNAAYARGIAGDAAGAAANFEEVLRYAVRALGPKHPDTLIVRSNLARWRGEAGNAAGAATVTENVLADMAQAFGPDHPDTLIARGNLARWRGEARDATGAATFEELRADMERVLGPDHPETLIARSSVAFWLGRTGDAARAAAAFGELLADMERVLGPDHQRTLATRDNLAYYREQAGLE